MWSYKCPRCRHGDIFAKPFEFSNPLDMPERCAECNQRTTPEPGFYFGAMFLSYIFFGWFVLLPTLLLVFYFKWSVEGAMVFAIALTAVCYFRLARTARSLWFHMMVKYDPELSASIKAKKELKSSTPWKPNINKSK